MINNCTFRNFSIPLILGVMLVGTVSCSPNSSEERDEKLILISDEIGPFFLQHAGMEIEHVVPVRNPSKTEAMTLKVARRSCNCLNLGIPPDPISPGATGRVKLHVSVPYRTGVKKAALQLTTGLSDKPDLVVRLSILTHARISVDPPKFPVVEVKPGNREVIPFDVVLRQPLHEAKLPASVEGVGDRLTVEVVGETAEDQDEARVITLNCQATIRCPGIDEAYCPAELVEETIRIRYGEHSANRTIGWRPPQIIALQPKKLFFQSGTTSEKLVRLRATEPFAIVSVESEVAFVRARLDSRQSKTDHEVRIQVLGGDPEQTSMASTAYIEFRTNHPEQQRVRLPVFVLWAKRREPSQP